MYHRLMLSQVVGLVLVYCEILTEHPLVPGVGEVYPMFRQEIVCIFITPP